MEEMIIKAKERDADAFTRLIQSQMQSMYKVSRAILHNDEDCADAVSQTILTCWERIDTLRENKYFKTWLTRILINTCNDIIRKNHGLVITEEIPHLPVQDSFRNVEFLEVLNSIDEKYRLTIILYYVEGFKTSEIAELLDIPEATVRTRLARGRKLLKEEYQEERKIVSL